MSNESNTTEHDAGYALATKEIEEEFVTPASARLYMENVSPATSDFDKGFDAAFADIATEEEKEDATMAKKKTLICIIGNTKKTAHLDSCGHSARSAGLCHGHYQAAQGHIRKGNTTKAKLRALGLHGEGGNPVGRCEFFNTKAAK